MPTKRAVWETRVGRKFRGKGALKGNGWLGQQGGLAGSLATAGQWNRATPDWPRHHEDAGQYNIQTLVGETAWPGRLAELPGGGLPRCQGLWCRVLKGRMLAGAVTWPHMIGARLGGSQTAERGDGR